MNFDGGIVRVKAVLQALGNPHHRYPIIHVAGTNGKGSVCAYIAQILRYHGLCGMSVEESCRIVVVVVLISLLSLSLSLYISTCDI